LHCAELARGWWNPHRWLRDVSKPHATPQHAKQTSQEDLHRDPGRPWCVVSACT